MLTSWGETPPDVPWPEYPRPQMVRSGWVNLNGTWQYAIRPRAAAAPTAWDGDILVPFAPESPLSGVERGVSPEERLWYRRSLTLTPSNTRTLLHFGAVDYSCALWVNGAWVGAHSGGFDPFQFDVTDYLVEGVNELLLACDDPGSSGEQPRGKQHLRPSGIWYTPVSGIWQTVWLEHVPLENHVQEVRIQPAADLRSISVAVLLGRPTRRATLAVRLTVLDADRQVVSVIARPDRTVSLDVAGLAHWSPGNPTLHGLRVELVEIDDPLPPDDDAQLTRATPLRGATEASLFAQATVTGPTGDSVECYFALRLVSVGRDARDRAVLQLNGEPTFHLGTLDQGWWPDGLLTPPADAAIVHELEYLKGAGFNTIRKHIKIEPARYYYHCDRLGLLVWQDMPSGFLPAQFVAPNDEGETLRSAPAMEQHELELARMVNRLSCHPSIVMWVISNEGWGQYASARLAAAVKALDPDRLVNAHSGWIDTGAGDVIDVHDYRRALDDIRLPADGRVAVLGEYGGIGWPLPEHLWKPEIRNWGYQTYSDADAVLTAYLEKTREVIRLRDTLGICGAIYTQTCDVEGEVNGLLTYDRRVEKLDRDWLRSVHAELQ